MPTRTNFVCCDVPDWHGALDNNGLSRSITRTPDRPRRERLDRRHTRLDGPRNEGCRRTVLPASNSTGYTLTVGRCETGPTSAPPLVPNYSLHHHADNLVADPAALRAPGTFAIAPGACSRSIPAAAGRRHQHARHRAGGRVCDVQNTSRLRYPGAFKPKQAAPGPARASVRDTATSSRSDQKPPQFDSSDRHRQFSS
jgi:hypothetical protein